MNKKSLELIGKLQKEKKNMKLEELFKNEQRAAEYTIRNEDLKLTFDYSKNLCDGHIYGLLFQIAEEAGINAKSEDMFTGENPIFPDFIKCTPKQAEQLGIKKSFDNFGKNDKILL